MAEIRDDLILDIDQALRQIDQIERSLDTALQPIEVRVDPTTAQRQLDELARDADRALSDVDVDIDSSGAARLNDELAGVERNLTQADSEADQLANSLREADRAADRMNTTTSGTAAAFSRVSTAALGIASAFAAIGAGQLFSVALRGANTAIQTFAQLTDSVNAVNVVFGSASASVLQFGEDAAASAGLSELAFNQAVVPIGGLLRNFGFDAREAADAAVILVQRGADLASVYGGTVQDALLAVGAALRGEADPLERYSASISAARVEAFALANGLARTKAEITPAITLQARYGLILEDTARVSGDFVNTSDDLANAQRSAGAAVQNFVADIGESLAPALETILALLPEVLEGVRQLVPAFAAAGDSAAAFFEARGEGGGFRTEFSLIRAGFEAVTSGAGIASEATQFFGAVAGRDLKGAGEAVKRLAGLFAGGLAQGIAVNFARQLDAGTDSVEAFNTAVRQVARSTSDFGTFTASYRDFAVAAGLTAPQLRDATAAMIENADTMGLNAQEVAFLTTELAFLNEALFGGSEAVKEFNRIQRELAADDVFSTVTTRFTTFADGVEEGTDRASVALAELAAASEREQARTEAAFNLFEDLPEKISGSFAAAVDALRENVEAIAQFDINLAILEALELDALAEDFREKGIAAAGQLEQAINDIPLAIEADQILQGVGIIGEEAFDELVKQFISVGMSPADAAVLAEKLSSPQVIAASREAGKSIAGAGVSAYREALIAEGQAMDTAIIERIIDERVATSFTADDQAEFAATETVDSYVKGLTGSDINTRVQNVFDSLSFVVDLFTEGQESRQTFLDGLSTAQANEERRLHDSIESTLNNAIQKRSPPKLFMDAGLESGEAFWSGFNQSNLTLKTALPGITGKIAEGSMPVAGAGSTEINFNLPNLETRDADVTIARATQLAGSVAGILNGNFKL